MKRLLTYSAVLLLTVAAFAQAVPVSPHLEDQQFQGPCYVFAFTAALESKAILDPTIPLTDPDFDEWYFFSAPVLTYDGAFVTGVWSGHIMIPAIAEFMNDFGVQQGQQPHFTTQNLPNRGRSEDDNSLPGLAHFENGCQANSALTWSQFHSYEAVGNNPTLGQTCDDIDQNEDYKFNNRSVNLPTYSLLDDAGDLYIRDNSPTPAEVSAALLGGSGVVGIFQNWEGSGREHSVFIYSKSGNNYSYKDSWPGGPGFDSKNLFTEENFISMYYLPGRVIDPNYVQPPGCEYAIEGSNNVSGVTTFTLGGGTNVSWSLSGPLQFDGPSTGHSVKVASTICSGSSNGTVSVSYTNNGMTCPDVHDVTITSLGSGTPSSIQINGPTGLNTACPGSAIQLQAIDTYNPSHPTTTYNWSISGATILNGQGTPIVNIQINNGTSVYQNYKVRAKKGSCSYSGWRTLSGYVTQSGCNGGIFPPGLLFSSTEIDASRYFINHPNRKEVKVDIYTLSGQKVSSQAIQRSNNKVPISRNSNSGVWIVNVTDPESGVVDKFRIYQNND